MQDIDNRIKEYERIIKELPRADETSKRID
jgi:hypothetical protein